MRKNLNPADIQPTQLPHPGLGGYSEKEILNLHREFDDEKKRLTQGDISPLHFSTHQFVQMRYIPCVDEAIERFEEKVILPLRVCLDDKNAPEGQSDQHCAECKSVVVIKSNGCAHCIAVTEETTDGAEFLANTEEVVIEDDSETEIPTRKLNRANTKTVNPRIGNGGYTRATSPHLTQKGWKPSAPVVQEKVVGSLEVHWNDPVLQKKIKNTGFKRIRKNTRMKVSTLEARKSERIGVARLKGKL